MDGRRPIRIICWNIRRNPDCWKSILNSTADLALLQEANAPPPELDSTSVDNDIPWSTDGGVRPWRTAIIKLSDRVSVEWLNLTPVKSARGESLGVSHPGTLSIALVKPRHGTPFIAASMYAAWLSTHPWAGKSWSMMSDASAHRIISDLSLLIGSLHHRIIAAGDLNIYHGYGDRGSSYWKNRYDTVFARMSSIGMCFVGPKFPNGRRAESPTCGVPCGSGNVPTHYDGGQSPRTACHQVDYVFASNSFAPSVTTRALNDPDPDIWGDSDHCRVEILVFV